MWYPEHLTTLWAPTACYRDSFISFFVHDVRTAQETHVPPGLLQG
jgi:hypothetical protein